MRLLRHLPLLAMCAAIPAHAQSYTATTLCLRAGAEPRTLGIYDTSGTCVEMGELNSSSHIFSLVSTALLTNIAGDSYWPVNATYDGVHWNRTTTSAPSWLLQFNVANNMYGETYKAFTIWRAAVGANPIGDYTTAGGWLMGLSLSQYGDMSLGSNGIELDGNGTIPYGRLQHATVATDNVTGLSYNVFLDETGVDDAAKPQWFSGLRLNSSGVGAFKVQHSAAAATPTWVDMFTVNESGIADVSSGYKIGGVALASTHLSDTANLGRLNANQTWTGQNLFTQSSGTGYAIATSQATSGAIATTSDVAYNKLNVITDEANPNAGMGRDPMSIALQVYQNRNTTSAVQRGGQEALYVFSQLANPTGTDNRNRNYVGARFDILAPNGDGGAHTTLSAPAAGGAGTISLTSATGFVDGDTIYIVLDSGNYHKTTCALSGTTCTLGVAMPSAAAAGKAVYDFRGGFFSMNPFANMSATSIDMLNVSGAEYNVSVPVGGTMGKKSGLDIVQSPTDKVAAIFADQGIGFSNQSGAVGWKSLISAHYFNGAFPLQTTGSFISVNASVGSTPTFANFADLSTSNITGNVLNWANGSLTGSGLALFANGAVGGPTYAFSSDATTGMYLSGTNQLGFTSAGAIKMQLDNASMSLTTATATAPFVFQHSYKAACSAHATWSQRSNAYNGSSSTKLFAWIDFLTNVCTAASESGGMDFKIISAGSNVTAMSILATAEIGFPKLTASGTAPGAGICKTSWVAGTGAGTGKLIAYCGTSTTPSTIVDNVGGGF